MTRVTRGYVHRWQKYQWSSNPRARNCQSFQRGATPSHMTPQIFDREIFRDCTRKTRGGVRPLREGMLDSIFLIW
jgi:hypothetical protein